VRVDNLKKCKISGVNFLDAAKFEDERGYFKKVFSTNFQDPNFKEKTVHEVFYTQSHKGVIRGMHVQASSAANFRFIFCVLGKVHDAIIDLRPNSATYGNIFEFEFHEDSTFVLQLPPGVAHGFQCLSTAILGYVTTSRHQTDLDSGVNPLSIKVAWPLEPKEISKRDITLPDFCDWKAHLSKLEGLTSNLK
jgi:dTDP-4-dehydrorhamnose 3,5-epimerase